MMRPGVFRDFVGNPRVVGIIQRAIARDRLPHAMIFAGPNGIGKRCLAELVASRLNCFAPRGDEPCGACGSCRKIAAGMHPDVRTVEPDGTFIKIDQVRALTGEIAFEPFEARYRVAVLDPADSMRHEAASSLLKTLEEPPSRTFLILITANPYALLATIRSRCRLLQFGAISGEMIEHTLMHGADRRREEARMASEFCRGSLAAALAFDARLYEEARAAAVEFVGLMLGTDGSFTDLSRLAGVVAKDKEKFEPWLDSVEAVLRDVYYARFLPARIADLPGASDVTRLARSARLEAVVSTVEGVRGLRRALAQNVNRQLALEALFVARPASAGRFVQPRGS